MIPSSISRALRAARADPAAWPPTPAGRRQTCSSDATWFPTAISRPPHTDPNLVNGWGVAFNPFGFVWVAAADGMVSTLYDGDGNVQSLVVQIPVAHDDHRRQSDRHRLQRSDGFVVTQGALSGPSRVPVRDRAGRHRRLGA